jgi:ribosomal protein S27E
VVELPDGRGKCLLCGKVLSSISTARRHSDLSHGAQEAVSCHLCDDTLFSHQGSLNNHLRRKHNIYQSVLAKQDYS